MRAVTLNAFSAGMTRLRTKGGASPETLYELTNGYVTASRTLKQRPALTYQHALPTASKGLVYFKGVFYTFSAASVSPVAGSTNLVLIHPTPGFSGTLLHVHFAHPFMGYLYVVAEFSDNAIYHYWLQMPAAWKANHQYKANDLVQPTTPNGLYYRAVQSTTAAKAWTPGVQHSLGDVVQPTVYNGFAYDALGINGAIPPSVPSPTTASSGQIEPTWPLVNGATVLETSSGAVNIIPDPAPTPPPATPPGLGEGGRYTNLGGSGGRGSFGNTPVRVP